MLTLIVVVYFINSKLRGRVSVTTDRLSLLDNEREGRREGSHWTGSATMATIRKQPRRYRKLALYAAEAFSVLAYYTSQCHPHSALTSHTLLKK